MGKRWNALAVQLHGDLDIAVWSLTPFLDELDILEIRLATLDPVVDFHVIGESPLTHSGKPKPMVFAENAERFRRWKDKIVYRVIDFPAAMTDWAREKQQRKALWYGFAGKPDDLVLLSDVDEIPNPTAVRNARFNILLCNMHVGKLNWRWAEPAHESWAIARIFPAHSIGTRFADLEEARLTHMPPLGPAGWHLSWMNNQQRKLDSFVHQELVPHADIQGALKGQPLFPDVEDTVKPIEWVGLDQLPAYVAENKDRFNHMMIGWPDGS